MDNASSMKSSIIELLDQDKGEEKLVEHPTTNDSSRCQSIASYSIMRTPATQPTNAEYSCQASTILSNIQRLVLRAMQLNNKPILILRKPWRRQNESRHGFASLSWLSFHSNQSV
jgi:hypothetical protein